MVELEAVMAAAATLTREEHDALSARVKWVLRPHLTYLGPLPYAPGDEGAVLLASPEARPDFGSGARALCEREGLVVRRAETFDVANLEAWLVIDPRLPQAR